MVSNRLPMSVSHQDGQLMLKPSVGGLATGLSSFYKAYDSMWIGWPGLTSDELVGDMAEELEQRLKEEDCLGVPISLSDLECYYEGFSNKTIWPLFHYFPEYVVYDDSFWECYKRVNEKFCDRVLSVAKPEDTIWIHDYHLMLLPGMIRERMPEATIGFFLHIPFPSYEVFRLMPQRAEILEGIMGADLIGFHTYGYVRGFLDSARMITGREHAMGRITVDSRLVKVDAFPMGIDYDRFASAVSDPKVREEVADIRWQAEERKIIVSIDRLDYSKGIIQRLEAFKTFLEMSHDRRDRVTLILVVVPSRTEVDQYADMKRQVDELVGHINGTYGSIGFVPIWYLYRSLPFHRLIGLYSIADVALVTPLRDGMNLVAKEYVACKTNQRGALILSEMAGAANELGEAILVNPNNTEAVALAIKQALEMSEDEQRQRMASMQERLERYNVAEWAQDFLDGLGQIKNVQMSYAVRTLNADARQRMVEEYKRADKRLFLFDYDGTLVPFADRPELAVPDEGLIKLLALLSEDEANQVVIVSNRDRYTLGQWLGHLNLDLVAEHGFWVREKGEEWTLSTPVSGEWKDDVRPIMEVYVDRTPGSLLEEKDFSLVWHFRTADPALGAVRAQELKDALRTLTAALDMEILDGNKIVMVKPSGMNKGRAAASWLVKKQWDFILCAGDDWTDEDMFVVLPDTAYSLRVGLKVSRARFNLNSPREVRRLLSALIG